MNKPARQINPKVFIVAGLIITVAGTAWQVGIWRAGTWAPGADDLIRFSLGFVLGLVVLLPDYLQYRREGDDYVRALLSQQIFLCSARGRSGWFLGLYLLYWLAMLMVVGIPGRLHPIAYAGFGLGLTLLYPFVGALSKRMWELYEQDQGAASSVPQPVPSAPEAR
jgi:hypothetical protein